eukprot:3913685-Pyramimonas_sp.AAC.1
MEGRPGGVGVPMHVSGKIHCWAHARLGFVHELGSDIYFNCRQRGRLAWMQSPTHHPLNHYLVSTGLITASPVRQQSLFGVHGSDQGFASPPTTQERERHTSTLEDPVTMAVAMVMVLLAVGALNMSVMLRMVPMFLLPMLSTDLLETPR